MNTQNKQIKEEINNYFKNCPVYVGIFYFNNCFILNFKEEIGFNKFRAWVKQKDYFIKISSLKRENVFNIFVYIKDFEREAKNAEIEAELQARAEAREKAESEEKRRLSAEKDGFNPDEWGVYIPAGVVSAIKGVKSEGIKLK